MINKLIALADSLDKKGLTKEADEVDKIIEAAVVPILTIVDLIRILSQHDSKTPVVVRSQGEGAEVPKVQIAYTTKAQDSISLEPDSPKVDEEVRHDQKVLLLGSW